MQQKKFEIILYAISFLFLFSISDISEAKKDWEDYMSCGGGEFRFIIEPRKNGTARIAIKFKPYSTVSSYKSKNSKWPGLKKGVCGIHNKKLKKGENIFVYETDNFIRVCIGMLKFMEEGDTIGDAQLDTQMSWPTDFDSLAIFGALNYSNTTISMKVKRTKHFARGRGVNQVGIIEVRDILGIKKNKSSKWLQNKKALGEAFPALAAHTSDAPGHCFKDHLKKYLGWTDKF